MELVEGKGTMTPHEQYLSPRHRRRPQKGKTKVKKKKKKIDMEGLKKEVVMVRKPKMDAEQLPSENIP